MEPKEVNIGDILLQQPPFRFVDSLESYDEAGVTTLYEVPQTGVFVQDYRFEEGGIVENMAQASAARSGYRQRFVLNLPVSIGYIGQVKKYRIERLPKKGEELTTTVHLVQDFFNVSMTDIEVRVGEELIASASLKSAQASQ